jgi:ribosomal protein L18E
MRRKITNPELLDTIRFLKAQARKNKAQIWAVTAECLSAPRRNRAVLDLNHISRASKRDAFVLVHGKV